MRVVAISRIACFGTGDAHNQCVFYGVRIGRSFRARYVATTLGSLGDWTESCQVSTTKKDLNERRWPLQRAERD